jgi:hypothetical protein
LLEFVPSNNEVGQDVIARIVEAAEEHLGQLLLEMSEIACHRLEPLRANSSYRQISDPRKQLKAIEEHEKQALVRQEFAENEEILIKTKGAKKHRQVSHFGQI